MATDGRLARLEDALATKLARARGGLGPPPLFETTVGSSVYVGEDGTTFTKDELDRYLAEHRAGSRRFAAVIIELASTT
jgi:hypothetical protein